MNEAYNIDCMEFMRRVPSKYFDLAVVDPPYGIEKGFKETSRVRRYGQTKTANDDKPTAEYFTELFRVSKNQIIWGLQSFVGFAAADEGIHFLVQASARGQLFRRRISMDEFQ